jgi:hypothetical protein
MTGGRWIGLRAAPERNDSASPIGNPIATDGPLHLTDSPRRPHRFRKGNSGMTRLKNHGWTLMAATILVIGGCAVAKRTAESDAVAPATALPVSAPAEPVDHGESLERIEVSGTLVSDTGTAHAKSPAVAIEIADGSPGVQAQAGVLTAGDYDDLLNPHLYARYAEKYLQHHAQLDLPFVDTRSAVKVRVVGSDGEPVAFAQVGIVDAQGELRRLFTATNGTAVFFPALDRLPPQLEIRVEAAGAKRVQRSIALEALPDDRIVSIQIPGDALVPRALDLALVIDTTGSMSDELRYLQAELDSITATLRRDHPRLDIRIGLVVYRDEGDEYVTRRFALTSDVSALRTELSAQLANGGGDYPEAVHQAFADANRFDWREDAVKVLLHVADAPPHADRMAATWNEALALRARGVHIVPIAASGVADEAQYLMRSSAALTQARYLFLTDDSGVGLPHQEPDVPCYVVTRLDGLIERVIATLVTGRRVEPASDAIVRTSGDYARGVCLPGPAVPGKR